MTLQKRQIPHRLMVAALRFSHRASAASALRVLLIMEIPAGIELRLVICNLSGAWMLVVGGSLQRCTLQPLP